jgi:hypothetical protein
MPAKSKSQFRLMQMAAAGKSDKVPAKVAKEFLKETPKEKFKKLKERLAKG